MTNEELQVIQDRCNKATAGPWYICTASSENPRDKTCMLCGRGELLTVGIIPGNIDTYHFHRLIDDESWHEIYTSAGRPITGTYSYSEGGITSSKEDAEFIAHARNDIPVLLAEIKRLKKITDLLTNDGGRL